MPPSPVEFYEGKDPVYHLPRSDLIKRVLDLAFTCRTVIIRFVLGPRAPKLNHTPLKGATDVRKDCSPPRLGRCGVRRQHALLQGLLLFVNLFFQITRALSRRRSTSSKGTLQSWMMARRSRGTGSCGTLRQHATRTCCTSWTRRTRPMATPITLCGAPSRPCSATAGPRRT